MDRELRNAIEILPGRVSYVPLSSTPPNNVASKHFFSIDNELVYWNFYLDFGPLNLGQLYRFCMKLNEKLGDPRLKDRMIYYYSGTHGQRRANAAFLICGWSMLYMGRTADDAFKVFRGSAPFPPWHDATPTVCTFNLTILDTLRGLQRARECNFFNFDDFDIVEYEHYEQVENGDLNWIQPGKFIAFAGPHGSKDSVEGYRMLTPDDYIPYFKKKKVSLVVRLNKKYYDAKRFTSHGIDHIELYFLDGSNPPDHILSKFMQACEATPGAVAVHCKAGLGRTGCCIGSFIMKHLRWTAEEFMGWARIVRPGTIIGPQQNWLKETQNRMWKEGDIMRARLKSLGPPGGDDEASEQDIKSMKSVTSSMSSVRVSMSDQEANLSEMTQGDFLNQRRQQQLAERQQQGNGGGGRTSASTSTSSKGFGSTFGKFLGSSWK